jgi:acyl-CoA dehydrogenase
MIEGFVEELIAGMMVRHARSGGDDSFDSEVWQGLTDHGYADMPIHYGADADDEPAGLHDSVTVARVVGQQAVSVPFAEALIGKVIAGLGGVSPNIGALPALWFDRDPPDLEITSHIGVGHGTGYLEWVPWARHSTSIVVLAKARNSEWRAVAIPRESFAVNRNSNLAKEARDSVDVDGPVYVGETPIDEQQRDLIWCHYSLLRTSMIIGAARAALELTIDYANVREQFGRPIRRFQAVQQMVAGFVGEVRLGESMVAEATRKVMVSPVESVAAAHCAAASAADVGFRVSHQVHGAMGFTDEHPLHNVTRRLLAWRDEPYPPSYWATGLERLISERRDVHFWDLMVAGD